MEQKRTYKQYSLEYCIFWPIMNTDSDLSWTLFLNYHEHPFWSHREHFYCFSRISVHDKSESFPTHWYSITANLPDFLLGNGYANKETINATITNNIKAQTASQTQPETDQNQPEIKPGCSTKNLQ